jgi:hypothetical protein
MVQSEGNLFMVYVLLDSQDFKYPLIGVFSTFDKAKDYAIAWHQAGEGDDLTWVTDADLQSAAAFDEDTNRIFEINNTELDCSVAE